MKFGYAIHYVADVEATLNFYNKAFGFAVKFITLEKDYGELDTGSTTIAFASRELCELNFGKDIKLLATNGTPVGVEFAFVSEYIEEDFSRALENGAVLFSEIKVKPWGQKVGYVRDNNGFIIEICTPIKSG
ncbi:VOC family protein [Aureibacter tunicatorum]|uniref:Glyoxalase superfamily protein PhnB n=1 Tax=Aureibacter tunicatorum TaxID=866807 RepID=A0AAE4BT64_9BACT|nr:VOC family protein [Aureibacter tunicatorum]MDR6239533.1 putative glyoxalase superfamily protein PhnB [Aureibacter tunicatorum]BDD04010.1 lactoylglutathione lyase [Aureibacter tunicatorum]